MAVAICKYLLQQDQFKPNEVVILTPYLGQVRLLAQRMHSQLKDVTAILSEQDRLELENGDPVGANLEEDASSPAAQSDGVRVSSVDNFQGEESKVVIISLVRSNEYGSIGFLNQHQPVNVLLSRAKNGMYILGNRSTLTRRPKGERAWGPIMARLSGENRIVGGIPARCQVHTESKFHTPPSLSCFYQNLLRVLFMFAKRTTLQLARSAYTSTISQLTKNTLFLYHVIFLVPRYD